MRKSLVQPEALPAQIGRYRVLSELGRGMMGVVYQAEDPALGRTVALKVIRLVFPVTDEQREAFEQRFLAEARIVARLSHPNIVVVHDVGRDGEHGSPYMALEYLVGRTLLQVLRDGPPPEWRQSLRSVARLAEALHYAHGQGVVHRDVKPANVMLLESGQPKLMDFGLAKLHAGFELTVEGQFMGTPLYMSPEQATGAAVDGRSDLFSLGSVLYTLLTGTRAFAAESVPRILNRVTYDEPLPPTRVNRSLPVALDYVLARALAKPPEARYPDGHSLAEDLEDVLAARPPRHRARWMRPQLGELTMASASAAAGPPSGASPEHEGSRSAAHHAVLGRDETVSPPVPRRRASRAPLALLVLCMLSFGAVLYGSAFWRERLARAMGLMPSPTLALRPMPPPPPRPTPPAEPSPAPEALAGASPEPLEPVAVAAELPPSPAASPSDTPSEPPSATPSASPVPLALPSPSPEPTPSARPTVAPAPRPTAAPSAKAATKPSPRPTAKATPKPKPKPKATPKPKSSKKPKPKKPGR